MFTPSRTYELDLDGTIMIGDGPKTKKKDGYLIDVIGEW